MHVLHVTPRYFPNIGGVEIVAQKLSETLTANDIEATVYSADLSPTLPRTQMVNGVLIKRFSLILSDPFYIPEAKFITSLRREEADIIHVHNVHTLLPLIAVLCKPKKQKLLLQPHYHRFGQSSLRHSLLTLYRYGLSRVSSKIDASITNSMYEKQIFQEDFPTFKNVLMIPEGIDIEEVKSVRHKPETPKRILYVGGLRRYKNVDKILEGFAHLVKNGNTDYRLIIVGGGSEQGFLTNLADKLDVLSFVEWKSDLTRRELLSEYQKASVFILLSPMESFSRAVYEALLVGVPVVVLNFGALANFVKAGLAEGVNSLNPKEVAEALLRAKGKTNEKIASVFDSFLDWKEYSNKVISTYYKLSEEP
jgi:glycosyltransferase involved in cell wall biosynthesis